MKTLDEQPIVAHTKLQNDHFWGLHNKDGALVHEGAIPGNKTTRFYGFGQKGHASLRLWDTNNPAGITNFIYVQSGSVTLTFNLENILAQVRLHTSMSACCPGACSVDGDGKGVIIRHEGHRALFNVAGPIEPAGRLNYIDGASTTLLCPPARLGDPCLNLLHFPASHRQTLHRHPSLRFSIVASGTGWCIVPGGRVPLKAGAMFCIPEGGHHKNHTDDEPMSIITYHPITTVGWTDEMHPMQDATELLEDVLA